MNPYFNETFFPFFPLFFTRLWLFITGQLSFQAFASDEIQVIVLVGVAVSSALVGVFLMLRKMSMLANSISHTILVGIVIAYLVTRGAAYGSGGSEHTPLNIESMLLAAFMMGILTAAVSEWMTKTLRLQEDASLGLVFTSLFAIGIILVTLLSRNAHIGAEVVMGSVDALHVDDCKLVVLIMGFNLLLFFLFFKEYQITTFDPGLARALGISPLIFNYVLMIQVSTTIVGAFRAVGVLMVLAFITGPPLTARLLSDDLKKVVAIAVVIGSLASFVSVALSRHLLTVYGVALSTAGLVVCMILFFYLFVLFFAPKRGLVAKFFPS